MSKGRILVVEDDFDISNMLRIYFGGQQYEVQIAPRGGDALQMTRKQLPNLIILDIMLPDMNGYDVCQRVRRIVDYNPYVVILTARGNSNDRQRAEAIGANDFMTKPFNPARLMNQLSEIWGL